MKIISKYKDYYDYLTHIYGVDEKIIFNRECSLSNPILHVSESTREDYYRWGPHIISFCGKDYPFVLIGGEFVYDLKVIEKYLELEKYRWRTFDSFLNHKNKNTKEQPVIFYERAGMKKGIINPQLKNLQFHKIKTDMDAYLDLTNYLAYVEPEIKRAPEDMLRFEAKGFSKKTSFRHGI